LILKLADVPLQIEKFLLGDISVLMALFIKTH
jgi:hypothetical protein